MKPYTIIPPIEHVCGTKFLELKTATYIDKNGDEGKWDYVIRPQKEGKKSGSDVVTVACNDDKEQFLIIRQPRVPMDGKIVWSFPAGMTEGMNVGGTALKELREETGYAPVEGSVTFSKPLPKSAGLTNETSTLAECKLGKQGEQELEITESIKIALMTPEEIIEMGKSLPDDEYMSSGLWSYMSGYVKGKEFIEKNYESIVEGMSVAIHESWERSRKSIMKEFGSKEGIEKWIAKQRSKGRKIGYFWKKISFHPRKGSAKKCTPSGTGT